MHHSVVQNVVQSVVHFVLQLILANINNTKFNSTRFGQENWNYSGWVLLSVQIYFHCMHNIAETNYLKWQLSGGGKRGYKQYLAFYWLNKQTKIPLNINY